MLSKVTSVRSVINYAIGKIKEDWKVTFNAYGMDITKVLSAAEIIKTRIPFLHQENRFISMTFKKEGEESAASEVKRTGISVTLSK